MATRLLRIFKLFQPSDYTISTWLLLGACVQCFLVASLPRNIAFLPPVLFLAFRMLRGYLQARGYLPNPYANGIMYERVTSVIPGQDGNLNTPSRDSIVVLVLAATWSHPNGRFSPGSKKVGDYFVKMWRDAEANREAYGFLGNTPSLVSEHDGGTKSYGARNGDDEGKTLFYLSYWKTLDGLHKFAHAEAHRKGWLWWERGALEKYKHIGVMHEVYEVPAGNWENVFHNFRPFGMANAKFPIPSSPTQSVEDEKKESVQWVSGLRPASGKGWNSMTQRMGRKPGSIGVKREAPVSS